MDYWNNQNNGYNNQNNGYDNQGSGWNNGYNNNVYGSYNNSNYPVRQKTSGFAIASLILGIASIVTCCLGVFSIPLGALSILFAILSRRKSTGMPGMSIAGICTSIFGMLLGGFLLFYAFEGLYNPDFRSKYLDPLYENAYGMDFEEFMERYGYPID